MKTFHSKKFFQKKYMTAANQEQIDTMTQTIVSAFESTPKPELPDDLFIFGLTKPDYLFNPNDTHKHTFSLDILTAKISGERYQKRYKVSFSTNVLPLEKSFISSIITDWYSEIEKKCNGKKTALENFDDYLAKLHANLRELISHSQVDIGICVNCKTSEATLYLDDTKAELVYCSLKCADEFLTNFHKLNWNV